MEPALVVWVAPVLGLIIGSFLGALTYRLPRGQSVADGRSLCPTCEKPLKARDLVPVVSWVAMGGKCRCGRVPISPRYPLIELATGLAFFVSAWWATSALSAGILAMGAAFGIVSSVLWWEHRLVRWMIVLPALLLIILGVSLSLLSSG